MKMQIKNSYKVIAGITFLFALLFVVVFKTAENIARSQNALNAKTKANSLFIDVRILMTGDKAEALRNIITSMR